MTQSNLDSIHILVVDDEQPIRDLLKIAITRAGYDCSTAGDAQEALKALEENHVDVTITDIVMPGLTGIELTRKIRKKFDSAVIVMTGLAENYRYEKIIEEGASDFVEKPVRIQEILVRLKRVLRERAITIELKRSYGKLRRILWETVEALASALEKRDPYTAGHQKRVAKLGCALAEELGFSEKQIEGIQVAGNLHDIGKLSIPTDILNKPGQLSTNEFNLIKEHSQVGYEILVDIEFDQPISQIILQHHERMNGSGYPRGLSGEDIIAEARVLAVADVVESMVSHRPYRPALGLDRALAEISQNRGSHFDPTVADTCLKLCASGRFVFE